MERFRPYDDGTKSAAGIGGGMTDTEAAQRQANRVAELDAAHTAQLATMDEIVKADQKRREREMVPTDDVAVLVWEAPQGAPSVAPTAPSVYNMSMVAGEVRLTDLVAGRRDIQVERYRRVPKNPEAVAERKKNQQAAARQKQA